MIRPSFVPPPPIRVLRDLTRYRVDLVAERTAEKNRVEKLLEDAQIKLSVVASDIFGVSGRDMMAALIAGERDPQVLAQLARARMRVKIPHWRRRSPGGSATTTRSCSPRCSPASTRSRRHRRRRGPDRGPDRPFRRAVARLDEIPGVGVTAAQAIIAEVGRGHDPVPHPGHLASWARFAPGVKESAGRKKGSGSTGHGNRYLARALGEAAVGAARTDTFLGERYRRIARRRGKKKAIVAVGRSILVIIWHLLSDPTATFPTSAPTTTTTASAPDRAIRNHIRQLKPSATKSPSNPPPEPTSVTPTTPPLTIHFRVRGTGKAQGVAAFNAAFSGDLTPARQDDPLVGRAVVPSPAGLCGPREHGARSLRRSRN